MPKALHSSTHLAHAGLHPLTLDPILEHALREDWAWGDLTSTLIVPPDAQGRAEFLFKQDGVAAGLPVVARIFELVDPELTFTLKAQDGDRLAKGTIAAEATGSARSLLMAERVALNLLQRMSATATLARTYADALEGTRTQLLDTRKTTPGLRLLEKYAVRVGGGRNHRYGLADAIMIKDNHIEIAGSIAEAVRRARAGAPMTTRIEVETESLDMVREALAAGADIIMLDNMTPETMREAVALIDGKALTEASGGITLATIRRVAETGVDFISVGALTHSAGSLDISLDLHTR
ncbi:putative nicotinate-nucleotide pyrophosphorylase [carboxylating] [compost metagenome]